jgi:hypothetical protein
MFQFKSEEFQSQFTELKFYSKPSTKKKREILFEKNLLEGQIQ